MYATNLGGLAQALCAFLRLYKLTKVGPEGAMIGQSILLTMTDQLLQEILIMINDDEDCTITAA